MKVLQIDTDCTDNGVGLRTVIYVSGCWQVCTGCHNKESWESNQGIEYSLDQLLEKIEENPLADVTISGGDPLTFQYDETLNLVKGIKSRLNKNIWVYTGYTYEYLLENKNEILSYIDVLVDGRFNLLRKDLNLLFRGSSNQRIINVKESVKNNKIVLWKQKSFK